MSEDNKVTLPVDISYSSLQSICIQSGMKFREEIEASLESDGMNLSEQELKRVLMPGISKLFWRGFFNDE